MTNAILVDDHGVGESCVSTLGRLRLGKASLLPLLAQSPTKRCSPGTLVTLRHAFVGSTRKALARGDGELTYVSPRRPALGSQTTSTKYSGRLLCDLWDIVRSYGHEI